MARLQGDFKDPLVSRTAYKIQLSLAAIRTATCDVDRDVLGLFEVPQTVCYQNLRIVSTASEPRVFVTKQAPWNRALLKGLHIETELKRNRWADILCLHEVLLVL